MPAAIPNTKNLLFILLLCSQGLILAQSNNPYPYCFPAAANMTSGTCTKTGSNNSSYKFNRISILVNGQNSIFDQFHYKCFGTGNTDIYRFWQDTAVFRKGIDYTIEIRTPANSANDTASIGVWIDFNNDSTFSSNEMIGSGMKYNIIYSERIYTLNFSAPCNVSNLKTRIRFRIQNTLTVNGNDACGSPTGYGETWDFNCKFASTSAPSACIRSEFKNDYYTEVRLRFYNCSKQPYQNIQWVADSGISLSKKYYYDVKFNSSGMHCIKQIAYNCLGKDSAIKCFKIDTVTGPPLINFSTCNNVQEQYETLDFFEYDKTLTLSKGISGFEWEIYDSTEFFSGGIVKNFQSNAYSYVTLDSLTGEIQIQFNTPGLYTVKLYAVNSKGTSTVVKKDYVRYTPFYFEDYTLNFNYKNYIESNAGKISNIYDVDTISNYINNSKFQFIIRSADKQALNFKFDRIRMADIYDSVVLYDDSFANPSKILAIINSNNNGTKPVFRTSTSKSYIYFSSNASLTANGIKMHYYTDGNELELNQNFKLGHSPDPVTNFKTNFFNINQNFYSIGSYKTWYVDGVNQKEFEQKDTLKLIFTDTGYHTISIIAESCDSVYKDSIRIYVNSGKGITGRLYFDANNNCVRDQNEVPFINVPVRLYDANSNLISIDFSDRNGYFSFRADTGRFKINFDTSHYAITMLTSCHGRDSSFSLSTSIPYKIIDFDLKCRNVNDFAVQSVIDKTIIRRYFTSSVDVIVNDLIRKNKKVCSTDSFGGVLTIELDSNTIYDTSHVKNALIPSYSNNRLTYTVSDFSRLPISGNFSFKFRTTNRDSMVLKVELKVYRKDIDSSNNKKTFYLRVRQSYDPNLKEVYPEQVDETYNSDLTYTLHFQNTGTAAAKDVVLIDTLDGRLDPESFIFVDASHDYKARIDGHVLRVEYKDIELPDSFSDVEGSKGYFQFKIKPLVPLKNNEYIDNFVDIYFDLNSPVRTNKARTICLRDNYVIIPDPQFVKYLNKRYPGCMNGNRMDTTCLSIKQSNHENVNGLGIKNLFGLQFLSSLSSFNCNNNPIDSLQYIPSKIRSLRCRNTNISKLPYFSLADSLDCGNNHLTELPQLSGTLTYLHIDSNKLDLIKDLPNSLTNLNCCHNTLKSLPVIPTGLLYLNCSNNQIRCFEPFKESISTLNISGNPNKCLPNYIQAMDTLTKKIPICYNGDTLGNPDACAGIDKVGIQSVNSSTIKMYPNPVSEQLTIETGTEESYIITDISGRIVLKGVLSEGENILQMDNLKPGIYYLKLDSKTWVIMKE